MPTTITGTSLSTSAITSTDVESLTIDLTNGSGGSVTLSAPSGSGTNTITIPAVTGDGLVDVARSLSANGYVRISNGLIIQWGTNSASAATSGTVTVVTLPLAFPTACQSVVATYTGAVNGTSTFSTTAKSTATFTVTRGNNGGLDSGLTFNWIAIGY